MKIVQGYVRNLRLTLDKEENIPCAICSGCGFELVFSRYLPLPAVPTYLITYMSRHKVSSIS